jgi:transcriptional regulator with XRE-family HTH domain
VAEVDVDELIATNLRTLRIALGLSQAELAERATDEGWQVYQQTIDKIERGVRRLSLSEAVVLSRVLETSPTDLASGRLGVARRVRRGALSIAGGLSDLVAKVEDVERRRAELYEMLADSTVLTVLPDDERQDALAQLRLLPEHVVEDAAVRARSQEADRRELAVDALTAVPDPYTAPEQPADGSEA